MSDELSTDLKRREKQLAVKRSEHELNREKREDKDMRVKKWIIFSIMVVVVVASFVGTLAGWSGAAYVLTACISALAGPRVLDNLIQGPVQNRPGVAEDSQAPRLQRVV